MGLPQRDGRPKLDLAPEANPSVDWPERYNDPANELNKPVPLRKGGPAANGWEVEPYEALPDGPAGAQGKGE